MMKMMMMRWEPMCHKTEWQGHHVLRNYSLALSLYSYNSSPHIRQLKNVGGWYGQTTQHIWRASLVLHLLAGPHPGLHNVPINPNILYNCFLTGEDNKAVFLFPPIQIFKKIPSNISSHKVICGFPRMDDGIGILRLVVYWWLLYL